jgi:hypothetical protein
MHELGHLKREIFIRPLWQVEENDPAMVAIQVGDAPLVSQHTLLNM